EAYGWKAHPQKEFQSPAGLGAQSVIEIGQASRAHDGDRGQYRAQDPEGCAGEGRAWCECRRAGKDCGQEPAEPSKGTVVSRHRQVGERHQREGGEPSERRLEEEDEGGQGEVRAFGLPERPAPSFAFWAPMST